MTIRRFMNKKSKKTTKIVSLLVALVMCLGLAACGNENEETTTTSEAKTTEAANENGDSQTSKETTYPVEISDSNGNKVTIEKEPTKIVSVAPNLTEMVCKLGLKDKLVGRSDYCDYPADVADIQSVGTIMTPDIEKIVSLEPDLVIVSTHFDEENTKKLTDLGITILTLYDEGNVDGVYDMITSLGLALNQNKEAASIVSDMKTTIDDVKEKINGLEKPSVYYVVGYGEYGDYTAGGDTFIGGLIDLAGGKNIANDISGWSISLEAIVEANPDIIVISEYMKDDFMSAENYKELDAVKNGKVYTLDTNLLDRQGYRNAEGVLELAKIFHPEAFN